MIDPRIKQVHALIQRQQHVKAWPLASELLTEFPDDAQCLYLMGNVLRHEGHIGIALNLFRRALALDQRQPNVWMHYGACLHDTHQHDEAIEAFSTVKKMLPGDAMPVANIAGAYVQMGKFAKAIEYADAALAMDATNRIAPIAKAFGSLALGRWSAGWEHVQHLYGESIRIRQYTEGDEPEWDGTKGLTVVVQADQGIGDVIMFSQCLPQMVAECKKVIVECDPRLAGMLKRNFPDCDIFGTMHQDEIEWPHRYKIDARIHITLLGRFYRNADDQFPRKAYLTPNNVMVEKWSAWLAKFQKPWIGLAWRGGIPRTNNRERSIALHELSPILHDATFISLAYQDVGLEVARWNIDNPSQIIMPRINNMGDFDEWVALISCLDEVVAVPTTVVHVCGALGRKCRTLINAKPAWAHARTPIPWYADTFTDYRQTPGEKGWTHAIARLASDFNTFVAPC